MQKEPPHLTQVQRLFYIDSKFRTLRGRFRRSLVQLCAGRDVGIHHQQVEALMAVLPAWLSCPLPAAFSGSPTWRSSPGIPCRRSFGFQGAVLDLAIKKSPHNNLNLTILSGMALVRVHYVAIRKSKTCSGSFGSRAGTLSKYVILNRIRQKDKVSAGKIRTRR